MQFKLKEVIYPNHQILFVPELWSRYLNHRPPTIFVFIVAIDCIKIPIACYQCSGLSLLTDILGSNIGKVLRIARIIADFTCLI